MIKLSRRDQRKLETIEKHKKACAGCGIVFSKRDNTYCSNDCKIKHIQKKNTRTCDNCGKQFVRKYKQTTKHTMCSRECQAKVQSRLGVAYYESKAFDVCVKSKTLRIKKRYKAKRSALRKEASEGYAWWRLCKSELANIIRQESHWSDDWYRRCASASSMVKSRNASCIKLRREFCGDWTDRLKKEVIKCTNRTLYSSARKMDPWLQRMTNAAKNCKVRFLRKQRDDIGIHG